MTQNARSAGRPRGCWLAAQVVAALAALLLAGCLCASLATNAGLGGWAAWSGYTLHQERTRMAYLETEVDQLRRVLIENGLEVPLSPIDAQLMDTVEGQVAALRGLQPKHPVERALITPDRLGDMMREDFEADFPPDEARDYALTLVAFDLLDPGVDLRDVLLRLYTEQIAGFYDPETKQIYVVAEVGPMGQMARLTYAHEYTHALQDQYFDLEALAFSDEADEMYDDEYLLAARALVEGDASLLEDRFFAAHFSPLDAAGLMREALQVDTSVLDEVPDVLRESLFFPYERGQVFVEDLYEAGGWAAVDAAYANPPCSTEHILHPERYRAGDAPRVVSLPPLTDTLGSGWRLVYENVWGEYFTRYYLAQRIPAGEAEAAAAGWGGDRYAVYHRESDGALALVFHTVWDTPADAEEFVDAYVTFGEKRFGRAADMVAGGRMCWVGADDALCLAWGPADATILLGPDAATVEAVMDVVR